MTSATSVGCVKGQQHWSGFHVYRYPRGSIESDASFKNKMISIWNALHLTLKLDNIICDLLPKFKPFRNARAQSSAANMTVSGLDVAVATPMGA
jgi:hypothetical protein